MPNINILKNHEISQFDNPKAIPNEEKSQYFNFSTGPKGINDFSRNDSRLGYLLLKGYFMLYKKFLNPQRFRLEDVKYCCEILGYDFNKYSSNFNWYNEATIRNHKNDILEHYRFLAFKDFKEKAKYEALELVKKALRPKKIFLSLVKYLFENRVEIPDYGTIRHIITNAFNILENDIIKEVDTLLSDNDKELLDRFILLPVNDGEVSTHNPYLLTTLKKPSQDTRTTKIHESVSKFHIVADMFNHFEPILRNTSISDSLINYYAGWLIIVEQPQFNAIKDPRKKYVYVLSLTIYQYRLRQDLFVDTFLKTIQSFLNSVERKVKDDFLNQKQTPAKQVQASKDKIVSSFNTQNDKLRKVREILISNQYDPLEKISCALEIIEFTPNLRDQIIKEFELLENSISQKLRDEMFFDSVEAGSRRLSRKLKELFICLNFNKEASDSNMYNAVSHYQQKKGVVSAIPPLEFLNETQRKFVVTDEGVSSRLYKSLLLIETAEHLKAGSLNLRYSDNYRSINDYMIEEDIWSKDKENILSRSNLSDIKDIKLVLKELKQRLNKQYYSTNEGLDNNHHISFNKSGKLIIDTPKGEEKSNEFIHKLLSSEEVLPLVNILSEVAQSTTFLEAFTHFSLKGSRRSPNDETIFAGIIALGCNIGVRKMGKITKEIGAELLENTVAWHFTRENVAEANNKILEVTDKLAIPKYLKQIVDEVHTSSDGQKFGVSVPSIHSSYSYKYFGTGKGVTAYSFIDEYSRVFYDTVISTSEREAAYVLDGLLYNDVVESTIHSTDTHGYTEVVFGVCNSLGIEFAPRIKSAGSQTLYSFKEFPIKNYKERGFRIIPEKYIDEQLIIDQWDNILRLLASIKTKKVTASVIMKRLNSYSKTHPLYKALKELGRIHKSIFLLRYFDDKEYRKSIDKQLNKGELWHKFAKDVWFGNNQEFNVGDRESQELALSCRNLIQNSIVLWNYLNLTLKLSALTNEESHRIIENLSSSSLISWKHVNIHGEYDFNSVSSMPQTFNLEELVEYNVEIA